MLRKLAILLCLVVSDLWGQQSQPRPLPEERIYECQPITEITVCSDIEYDNASFPNFRNQFEQSDANAELNTFAPLICSHCSNAIVHMLCAYYAPFCSTQFPNLRVRPCKDLCEYVRNGCEETLNTFGLTWPEHLDCEQFDTKADNPLCFQPDNFGTVEIPLNLGCGTPPPLLPPPNTVSISPASGTAIAGQPHSLTCIVTLGEGASGTPTVEWGRAGDSHLDGDSDIVMGNVSMVNSSAFTSTLSFTTLRTSHRGEYTCRAVIAPTPQIATTTTVTVLIPQPVVRVTTMQPTYNGTVFDLICTIVLDPSVDTTVMVTERWRDTDSVLTTDTVRCINVAGTVLVDTLTYQTVLTFDPLGNNSRNGDNYICQATVVPDPESDYILMSTTGMSDYELLVAALPLPDVAYVPPGEATVIGQSYTLTCTVTVVDNLFVEPDVVWLGPNGNRLTGGLQNTASLQRVGSTSTLNFTFESLAPSHAGQYTCQACVSIDKVAIQDHCDSTTAEIAFAAEMFQLQLRGVGDCFNWVATDTESKGTEIVSAVVEKTEELCQCSFTTDHITEDGLQCLSDSNEVTFRAKLHRTEQATTEELIHYIEQLVERGVSVLLQLQRLRLTVDNTCQPVAIDSFDDPECPHDLLPTIIPATSPTTTAGTTATVGTAATVDLLPTITPATSPTTTAGTTATLGTAATAASSDNAGAVTGGVVGGIVGVVLISIIILITIQILRSHSARFGMQHSYTEKREQVLLQEVATFGEKSEAPAACMASVTTTSQQQAAGSGHAGIPDVSAVGNPSTTTYTAQPSQDQEHVYDIIP